MPNQFTHDDYTIAWICALPSEMAAATTMLDEIHSPLPQQAIDPNAYTVGGLTGHNIVIACLPSGMYGTTSAATVLSHMLPTFPSLRFGLMVGIGGGVPSKKVDIRLGDIVVSMPTASSGGVVQYDYGKALSGCFQRIGSLNKPPLCLLTAMSKIRSNHLVRGTPIEGTISDTLQKHQHMRQGFSCPDVDWLFSPTYDHQDGTRDCSTCDHNQRVDRLPRATKAPHIHYGLIASGNQVMKDAKTRDSLAREMDILCFEMEAAGLMDQLPCLVIRGICDYCDSHKNKRWQGYAALAAAAYAKELLTAVPVAFSSKRNPAEIKDVSVTLSRENLECLRSLGFSEQEHRFNDIHTAMHTCTWLLENLQYQAWMASSRGLFWIKGNPGSGKSVLMKFAVQSMNHIKTGQLVVSFFINGHGTHLQKTLLGVFRALLNGMLDSFPQYLSQLTQLFEDRQKRFGAYEAGRWNWAEKELQDIISRALIEGTKRCPVLIFMDALDECGADAATKLLAYFKDLMKNVEREGGQVKVCFSSRHYPILGLDNIPGVWVEEGNYKDIQFVIQDLLKEIEPGKTRQELEEKIFAKAQGGFQWAVLVCNKVIKEKAYGTKVRELHRMLKLLPEALDQLYSDILSDVQESERHQMVKLFRWVLFAERPLSAQELRDALSIETDMDCKARLRNHESWSDTLHDFELHVKHLSRGLVEFQTRDIWEQYELGGEDSDREAQFIHQSVADFLLNDFLCRKDRQGSESPVGNSHYQISRSCLIYLTLDEVLGSSGLPRYRLWTKFPLVPYAIQFLMHHIRKVEQESIPQHDLLSLIQWNNQSKIQRIANLWRSSDPGSIHTPLGWPFIGATALHVIAAFGSKSALDDYLQRGVVQLDGTDSDGNTPLMLAIREGHQGIALALLQRINEAESKSLQASEQSRVRHLGEEHRKYQSINVNAENTDGDTPLSIAVTENAGAVVLKLIEAGANVDYLDHSAALISCAIRSRDELLLKRLLEWSVNLDGAICCALLELDNNDSALEVFLSELLKAGANTGRSSGLLERNERVTTDEYESNDPVHDDHAISIASRRGQTAAVKILLSHGISATIQNQKRETPLLIALRENHEETARLLLETEPAAVELEDEDGQSPLEVAIEMNDLEMAMCLIKQGKFSTPSAVLQAAIYQSIYGDMLEVTRTILEKDRSTLYGGYRGNETPLHLAVRNGNGALVDILLEKGANVECTDRSGRRPLHLTAQHSNGAVVHILLAKGANIDCTNNLGETPLHLTARNGNGAVVHILLAKGANVEYTDYSGQTPLILAVQNRDYAVVDILLNKGAKMECTDNSGLTPLFRAVQNRDGAVMDTLIDKGANMECTNKYGQTPLLFAVQNGHYATIEMLLNKGANMECTDNSGQTSLFLAIQNEDYAIINMLLYKGAAIEHADRFGQTPLLLALRNRNNPLSIQLLNKGANPNAKDSFGITPIFWASTHGQTSLVRQLLEKGADLRCTDSFGSRPLSIAAKNGHSDVVKLLLERGATTEATDKFGQTALLLAQRYGYAEIVEQLLDHTIKSASRT